jgi:hypothetical protein
VVTVSQSAVLRVSIHTPPKLSSVIRLETLSQSMHMVLKSLSMMPPAFEDELVATASCFEPFAE